MKLSVKGRYVHCADCGSRGKKNGVCKICGCTDKPSTKKEKTTKTEAPSKAAKKLKDDVVKPIRS